MGKDDEPPYALTSCFLGRLHLGMCGKLDSWKKEDPHPQPWQHSISEEAQIIEWSARTLQLAIDQIEYLR
jgi:hypothetical protein